MIFTSFAFLDGGAGEKDTGEREVDIY